MAAKKKSRRTILRFRKNDPAHNLLAAVQHYVIAKGGDLVMTGGIEIQTWPGDAMGKFKVAVSCLGTKPSPATAD